MESLLEKLIEGVVARKHTLLVASIAVFMLAVGSMNGFFYKGRLALFEKYQKAVADHNNLVTQFNNFLESKEAKSATAKDIDARRAMVNLDSAYVEFLKRDIAFFDLAGIGSLFLAGFAVWNFNAFDYKATFPTKTGLDKAERNRALFILAPMALLCYCEYMYFFRHSTDSQDNYLVLFVVLLSFASFYSWLFVASAFRANMTSASMPASVVVEPLPPQLDKKDLPF